MKVRAELRQAYADQRGSYDALKQLVDDILAAPCRSRRWHYESRVKDEQSYALKIETGRVKAIAALEDFFGCAIVVRNSGEISAAISLVEKQFVVSYRRPKDSKSTAHRPATFEFDDLRLYVKFKQEPGVNRSADAYLLFEIQIKTFLFHAWSIATHELIYKSDDVNWGRERIAFQVRAMLEHAEITIQRASQLADIDALNRTDRETAELLTIIEELRTKWPSDQLPTDLRRLAQNIRDALRMVRVPIGRWQQLVAAEAAKGAFPLDENPYQVTVRALFEHEGNKVKSYIEDPQGRAKLVVYETVPQPIWFDPNHTKNLLRLS